MTPTEQAALDALVAWRRANLIWKNDYGKLTGCEYWDNRAAEDKTWVAADCLIAEREGR